MGFIVTLSHLDIFHSLWSPQMLYSFPFLLLTSLPLVVCIHICTSIHVGTCRGQEKTQDLRADVSGACGPPL